MPDRTATTRPWEAPGRRRRPWSQPGTARDILRAQTADVARALGGSRARRVAADVGATRELRRALWETPPRAGAVVRGSLDDVLRQESRRVHEQARAMLPRPTTPGWTAGVTALHAPPRRSFLFAALEAQR